MPAPKGNLYGLFNHEAGRPRFIETPQAFVDKTIEYFEWIKGEIKTEASVTADGKLVEAEYTRRPEPATLTGLALFLGFDSRQSFYDYAKKEAFSYVVKRARMVVEYEYEKKLTTQHPGGPTFALKNMGWADVTQLQGPEGRDLFKDKTDGDLLVMLKEITSKLNGESPTGGSGTSSPGAAEAQSPEQL
jgi:hypothetical protein